LEGKIKGGKPLRSSEEKVGLDKQNMALIEAALYVAGRPLDLRTLGSVTKIGSKKKVQSIARTIMKEYEHRDTSLEILELEDNRFVLQLKADYSLKVRRLAVRPLLTTGPLQTLSYIAYRQPVAQRQVIQARGGHAYNHIKRLKEMGLIECKKDGKARIIRTTDYFADYFGLSHDLKPMKRQLRNIFDKIVTKTIAKTMRANETVAAR